MGKGRMGKGGGIFQKVFNRKGSKKDEEAGHQPVVGAPVPTELPASAARPSSDSYQPSSGNESGGSISQQVPYRGLPSDPGPSSAAPAYPEPAQPLPDPQELSQSDRKAADRERGRALALELKSLREKTAAQDKELKRVGRALKSSAHENQALKERWNLQNFKYHLLLDMWALRVLDQDQDDQLGEGDLRQSLEDARHRSIDGTLKSFS